jgi:glutamine synthetase adenylyltransferase
MTKGPIDRLRAMAESERVRATAAEDLAELEGVQEWADVLTEFAEAIGTALDAVETWRDEEDREAKADSRDTAVEALQDLIEKADAVDALTPLEEIIG